jgi:hypothetical protein
MFASTILNSSVANSTLNSVNNGPVLGSHKTREDDRGDMWMMFSFGVIFAIGYTFMMGSDSGFLDFCYLLFCFMCYMGTLCVSLDEKQSEKAIKTSLVLSSILSLIMLVPFVCDMSYAIRVPQSVMITHINGITEYEVLEYYVDYPQIINIVFMYMLLLCCSLLPLRELHKMKKSV